MNRKPLTRIQKSKIKIQQAVIALFDSTGWKEDNYGNYKKIQNNVEYRYCFEDNVLRYESKITGFWVRVKSAYWKDIEIINGEITGWKKR